MGLLTLLNHVATFLLFASFILLLVTSISSPTVNSLSLLRVNHLQGGRQVTLGSWGLCVRSPGPDTCTSKHVGYNAGAYLNGLIGSDFGAGSRETIKVLTRAMILHPIATFFAFVAFASSAASSVFGAIIAMVFALITFILTIIVMGCDFGWASIIHHRINENNFAGGARAEYRECLWFVLVAALFTLLATCLLFVSCCSSRNRGRDEKHAASTRRRRFF